MKIYLFLLLQVTALSLYSQKNNSFTISIFDNYLSGKQIELKTAIYPFSSQIGINFGIASDFDNIENDHSIKLGVIYDVYRKDKLSISTGVRFVFERFKVNEFNFNSIKFAYNWDIPIDIKYDFLPRYNLSITMIPTWNRHFTYDKSVALSYSLGLGYYF